MNSIHPTAIIGPDVTLGQGNVIGAFAVFSGSVVIGDNNWFGSGTIIGARPEVRSFAHTEGENAEDLGGGVVIGDNNVFREGAQVHQGWKAQTRIGNDCFVMNQSYIAHDCHLGNGVTLASSTLLAGHVRVGDRANLGLGTKVHQFRFIGAGVMVGMGSIVTHDIAPCVIAFGSPTRITGVNRVGMQRQGYSETDISALSAAVEAGSYPEQSPRGLASDSRLAADLALWASRNDA